MWLQATPSFLGHECAVASLVGPRSAPVVLAHRAGLLLMNGIDGGDNFDTTGDTLRPMVEMLTGLQQAPRDRTDEVFAAGAPDRRLPTTVARIEQVVPAWNHELTRDEPVALDALVRGPGQRAKAIAECGVPDTLVHGDFHPGNVRGLVDHHVILDWGDAHLWTAAGR